jgi:hypothetical protein
MHIFCSSLTHYRNLWWAEMFDPESEFWIFIPFVSMIDYAVFAYTFSLRLNLNVHCAGDFCSASLYYTEKYCFILEWDSLSLCDWGSYLRFDWFDKKKMTAAEYNKHQNRRRGGNCCMYMCIICINTHNKVKGVGAAAVRGHDNIRDLFSDLIQSDVFNQSW